MLDNSVPMDGLNTVVWRPPGYITEPVSTTDQTTLNPSVPATTTAFTEDEVAMMEMMMQFQTDMGMNSDTGNQLNMNA